MAFDYMLLMNFVLVFVVGFLLWFVWLKGFLVPWLKVRFFMKDGILIRIKNPIQDYFVAGKINNDLLQYKARKRRDNPEPYRSISITQQTFNDAVYRSFSVPCIDVDDIKNCILVWKNESYKSVAGFNAEAMDEVVKTALYKPNPDEQGISSKTFQWIVIIGLLVIAVAIFFMFKQFKLIDGHVKMIFELVQPMYTSMNITTVPLTGI